MKSIRVIYKFLLGLLVMLSASPAMGQVVSGYSEYYIPGDEDTIGAVLCAQGATACPAGYHTHTVISVAAWSDNTTIYYDHWENGYNFDPANPGATADETYTLNTGGIKIFESANIALPTTPGACPCTIYDGRDRIYVAGGAVTVSRVSWIEERGVGLQGVAWEIYPIKPQLTTYIVPFGETSGWYGFQRVNVLIQATKDNTQVTIDLNNDGTPDVLDLNRSGILDAGDGTTVTLNTGQTFLLDDVSAFAAPGTLAAGAVITGTDTLQVKYITGRTDVNNQTRGFSAFPRGFWTKDYYAPLNQPGLDDNAQASDTDYYLYNPNSSTITVDWQGRTTSGTFNILANTVVSFRAASGGSVPLDSGLYFKGSDIFWGVGSNDANGGGGTRGFAHEWGYSLLPSTMLYTEHFLGWTPNGYWPADVPPGPRAGDNDMGVFLTVAQDNTRVFVDLNNDGTVDQTYTLDRLQTQYIIDPDGNLSGARIWATGEFSMAYGQNSDISGNSTPALDLGYVALPATDFVSLVLSVDKTVNPQVVPTAAGSTATFTLTANSQKYTVDNVMIMDMLPANWQYLGPTSITLPDMTTVTTAPTVTAAGAALPAPFTGNCPAGGGSCLTWDNTVLGNMAENQQVTISFTAQTTAVLAAGTLSQNRVKAIGTRTFGTPSQTQTFTTTDFAYVASGGPTITKASGAADPVSPGDTIPYTVTVTNPASATANLTGVSIYDPLPAGVSYVPASGSVTCDILRNVADVFNPALYNNTGPGSVSWAANPWAETDPGPGAAGAGAGFVWITAGQLQFRYLLSNVLDQFNTNGSYAGNNGSNNWSNNWTEVNDDGSAAITGNQHMYVSGNRLVFDRNPSAANPFMISRTANITGATSVTISFVPTNRTAGAGEAVTAEYSLNGGVGWTTLGTFDGGASGSWSGVTQAFGPIAPGGAASIILRFRSSAVAWNSNNDEIYFDNVDISFNVPANAVGSQIKRTANLTGATNATLNFDYNSTGLAAGDTLVIEAGNAVAGPFTVLATFTGGVPNVAPPYSLNSYISGFTTIQFRVTGGFNAVGKTFNVDNVDIRYIVPPASTFASGNPPDFLASSAGCVIAPGSSLTLTFSATVDDPFPSGQTIITNTASTSSVQIPMAVSASATNTVLVPSSLSASTGGRIWLDADADGTQDIGEPGIPNTEVTLKDQFGTPIATTLTDGNGRYLFTGVTPGTGYYVEVTDGLPAGLTQTYPYTSTPGDLTNNRTTTFTLVDGQVYTSGNIGYRAAAGTASFGDQVWVDADSDGIRDAGEVGMGGVTVQLYLDNNGDGVIDGGDTLAGTQTTAPDGTYLFTGATATGAEDYLVSVTTPAGYLATGATQFRYIDVTAGSTLLFADFGFVDDTVTTYTIKDRVWTDTDGDGVFDAGESGLAGVTIELLDASLNVIGTTISSADGTFIFSGVTGGGADYTVRINDTGGVLLDYYGTTSYSLALQRAESNLSANVDHTSASPFGSYGFRPLRSIGDTVFNDLNGNGVQDSGEPGIAGVIVSLYSNNAPLGTFDGSDTLISTVTTDASGQYLFSGLADGEYIVSVSVTAGYSFIPNGVVNPDMDGNAANGIQNRAAIAGGVNDLGKDFGFQATTPRTVSGTVWEDLDADGVIDGGESGLAGVTLDILSGSTVVGTVTTNASGVYTLPGLASGIYTVRITDTSGVLIDYEPTFEYGVGTGGPFDNQAPVDLTGGSIATVHFGFKKPTPTLVTLSDFSAYKDKGRLVVQWTTSSETDTAGFYLFRFDGKSGSYRQINSGLLPALITSQQGGTYSLIDNGASLTGSNTYLLMEIEGKGGKNTYGPFTVMAGAGNALESQYSSAPKAAGALTGITPGSAGIQARSITKYVDREGTLVIAAGSASSPGIGSLVTNEVSDFTRVAKAIPGTKQAALDSRAEARAAFGLLQKQKTGNKVKITVSKDGLYYMDSAEISSLLGLTDAWVRQLIRSGKLALTNQGNNVAYVPAEDMTGLFFYGRGIDSIYTKENVYWLYSGNGLQMASLEGSGPAPAGYSSYRETIHAEEDKTVAPVLATGPESDYWFWDYVIAGNPSLGRKPFDLQAFGVADSLSAAALTATLHGVTATGVINEHHVSISLNGTVIGEDRWKGMEKHIVNLSFSQSLLLEGTNIIEVKGLLDTGIPYSVFFVDSFDLTYQRSLAAHNDSLAFTAAGSQPLTVHGFTKPDLFIFDITDPDRPVLNRAATIDGSGGNYSISFRPSPGSRYLAIASDAAAAPVDAVASNPSSLSSMENMADYLIITTKELVTAAQELADYRQGQGLTSMIADIENIMDEFNHGISNPHAIRTFLAYAFTNWRKAPKYVLLAGDGTYDYKDNMGMGDNLLPTLMAETPQVISPSDNLYADMDNDHVPDIAIGRLPVLTAEELRSVIAKIIAYESTAGSRIVMLADNPDAGGKFPSDSDDVAALVPAGYSVSRIYLSGNTLEQARQLLFNEIQTGAVLVNYTGHAGVDRLAGEGLLQMSDVASLQNTVKPFVLAAMTCSVGNFALPGYDSLSEALVTKDRGGAVAVWAPSGLSYNYLSKVLDEQFFRGGLQNRQFFRSGLQNERVALGNVILKAFRNYQAAGRPAYIMDIFNLQGDPALRLW
ncbi:MAG: DUF11 domain-containing protein [Nitrospirae bacterium]|nr:DUF11 domain-containing protein [Nitrospirota bacterium]